MSGHYLRIKRERQNQSIARLTRDGERFEVLVEPQPALLFRLGKIKSVSQALITDTVFLDAGKGLKASEEKLRKAFGTLDAVEIASEILNKGVLQLTTEQRRQLIEDKRKQIVAFISRQCIDPRTNIPHPPLRIEQAMGKIRYSINPFKDTEEQAKEVIKLLLPILPIKIDRVSMSIHIPTEYAAKVYGIVKGFGVIKSEEWLVNGSWQAIIELPAGLYGPFLEKLGEKTRGNLKTKIIK